ncbi:MAG: tetratricopeptide repeat protein [Armatimonadetes bacterium]|nr:tetratricopeptide repeat protein [Armatimonadota bacterium]
MEQVHQVGQRLADGQRLFGEGKITEALAMAEQLAHDDPDNIAVMALKGDCLERQGDIDGALFCYENIVTLRPDSPLDRIRVAQLRRMVQAAPFIPDSKPDRRNSVFAAVAAFVLLTSALSAVVLANKKETTVGPGEKVAMAEPDRAKPFVSPAPVPSQGDAAAKTGNSSPDVQQPEAGNESQEGAKLTNPGSTHGPSARSNENRGVGIGTQALPSPGDGYKPVDPGYVATPDSQQKPTETGNSDPDPVAVKSGNEKPKTDNNGRQPIIDIHPSTGGGGETVGGSQIRENSPNEGKTLIQVARQYFLAGEYDKAAKAYEKAIKQGASPASANHRLAQCYLNLNKRGEALSAYQRALAAYQRMLDQGVGDKRLIESYMDECRQAIRLLQ